MNIENRAIALPTFPSDYTDSDRYIVDRFCYVIRSILQQSGWRKTKPPLGVDEPGVEFWIIGNVILKADMIGGHDFIDVEDNYVELFIDWDTLLSSFTEKLMKKSFKRMISGASVSTDPIDLT
jgi:hypothetical protein